jgi:hypothetical protein
MGQLKVYREECKMRKVSEAKMGRIQYEKNISG